MASAGVFPKTATSDIIYQADYNAIQSVIAGVVSTYYGNAVSSSQLSGNPIIAASHWDNLRVDINKAYKHITNADSSINDVAPGGLVTAADANAYKVAADYCETNKNTVAGAQLASAVDSTSITVAWNGNHQWTYTYTWPSAEAANYWFNAGGYFSVDVSGDGSTGTPKDADWQDNILNVIPTQTYGNTQWDAGNNIDVIETGNVSQYTENFARIFIVKTSSTVLTITVIINDADTGDQTGIGAPVDEDVNTNAYASITRYYSVDAITVTAPTPSNTSNW
jgi:hypothetical protein